MLDSRIFGDQIANNGRSLLIRSDPVYIHGMTGRSKAAAYGEDSRGAPFVWGVVAFLMLVGCSSNFLGR